MTDHVPGCAAWPEEKAAAVARFQTRAGTGSCSNLADDPAGMRAAFRGWNVWRSDEGCWWATRNRPLPPSRWPGSYDLTLTAADSLGLRAQIARQPR